MIDFLIFFETSGCQGLGQSQTFHLMVIVVIALILYYHLWLQW